MQKARRHMKKNHAPTACRRMVSGSISPSCSECFSPFPHGTGTLRPTFPGRSARDAPCDGVVLLPRARRNARGLGCSPVARHYWGNHCCFLFLRVLRCFSSPRWPHELVMMAASGPPGCPIRRSADQRPFAPTRGFSQLTTSFFASVSLGIHHAPLLSFSSLTRRARAPHGGAPSRVA